MDNQSSILIFLGVALGILVLAFLLSKLFKKSIARDKTLDDLNSDHRDASDHATWIGVRKSGGDDHLL